MFNESEHSPIYEPGEWMRLLESILSNANDAILVAEAVPGDEPGSRIIYANESFTRMTGYAPDEVIGKTPRLLQGENTDRERLDEIHRALSKWESVRVEVINYRKDGSEFWVELNIAPVVNESGRVTHWVSVQREITERRRIQISLEESEQRFRSVVQNSQEIIKITDADGTLRYASPAFERVFGYSSEKAVGINILDYVHQNDLARIQEEIKSALERSGGTNNKLEYRFRHADGSWRWVESVGTYLAEDSSIKGVVVNVRDVTERKQAQIALQESEQRLRLITSNAPVIMFAIDSDGVFTFESGAALKDLGREPGANVGQSVFENYVDLPEVLDNVRRALSGENVVATVRIGDRAYHTTYSPQFDGHGEVYGILGVATDITKRWKLEKDLEYLATHDPLTGLANRRLLFVSLAQALKRTKRREESLFLLYIDLNDFKKINDLYGHEVGDALLVTVTGRIEGCLRSSDMAARVGGDEFCVMLEGASNTEEAVRAAERLATSLQEPFPIGVSTLEINASIGIAVKDPDDESLSPDDLVRRADAAMYRAKTSPGRSEAWSL